MLSRKTLLLEDTYLVSQSQTEKTTQCFLIAKASMDIQTRGFFPPALVFPYG